MLAPRFKALVDCKPACCRRVLSRITFKLFDYRSLPGNRICLVTLPAAKCRSVAGLSRAKLPAHNTLLLGEDTVKARQAISFEAEIVGVGKATRGSLQCAMRRVGMRPSVRWAVR